MSAMFGVANVLHALSMSVKNGGGGGGSKQRRIVAYLVISHQFRTSMRSTKVTWIIYGRQGISFSALFPGVVKTFFDFRA